MADDPGALPTVQDGLRLAQSYLSRRAASTRQLRTYLVRKLRGRRSETDAPQFDKAGLDRVLDEVLGVLTRAGLLDDPLLARSRATGLAAKGLPATRVSLRLRLQGLTLANEADARPVVPDDETQARRFAERKRLGPQSGSGRAHSHERDMRAMVRAGFAPQVAARVLRELGSAADETPEIDP